MPGSQRPVVSTPAAVFLTAAPTRTRIIQTFHRYLAPPTSSVVDRDSREGILTFYTLLTHFIANTPVCDLLLVILGRHRFQLLNPLSGRSQFFGDGRVSRSESRLNALQVAFEECDFGWRAFGWMGVPDRF